MDGQNQANGNLIMPGSQPGVIPEPSPEVNAEPSLVPGSEDSPEPSLVPGPEAAEQPATLGEISGVEPSGIEAHDESEEGDYLEWSAVESLHIKPGMVWYVGLAVIVVALLVVAAVFQLWFSVAVFLVMGVAVVVYSRRQIAPIPYRVDNNGVTIDGHFYPYGHFKSFGVVEDMSWQTIDFESTRRFMPRLMALYNDDRTRDALVAFLSGHLPRADRHPDLFESVSRYLHLN